MYDYSFGPDSLLALLRESDFRKMPQLTVTGPTESSAAAFRAEALFWNDNPLEALHVKGKQVFRPSSFQSDLILRKIRNNIRNSFHLRTRGRRFIVDALISHLGEGLPYRGPLRIRITEYGKQVKTMKVNNLLPRSTSVALVQSAILQVAHFIHTLPH
jgi:hypothetical protein